MKKDNRVYFKNGIKQRDNVIYMMPKMPPKFKKLADTFFSEMRKLAERGQDGQEGDGS
jgi:hypothetical protein